MSIPVPKALTGKGWADIHNGKKAFLYALVLTIEELRKFIDKSKTKQQRTSHGMYLYTIRISIEQYLLFVVNMRLTTYLHHTWGFRRCSFRLVGQCEGLSIVERATELAPRFSYVLPTNL